MNTGPIFWRDVVSDLSTGISGPVYSVTTKWKRREKKQRQARDGDEVRKFETCRSDSWVARCSKR